MSKFKVGDLVEIVDDSGMCGEFVGKRVVLEESSLDRFDFKGCFEDGLVQYLLSSNFKLAYKFNVGDEVVSYYKRKETVHSILSEDRFVAVDSAGNFSIECFSEFKLKAELKVGDIVIDEFRGKGEILQFLGKDDMWDNNLLVKDSDGDFSIIDGDNLK